MASTDSKITRLIRLLDAWLLRRGFSTKTLRDIAVYEIVGCATLFLLSLALLAIPLTRAQGFWMLWFALGGMAATANYLILIISGQRLIRAAMSGQGAPRRGILADVNAIMLKLLLTAILFCAAAVFFNASLIAILAGFTLPVVAMLALGFIYAKQGRE